MTVGSHGRWQPIADRQLRVGLAGLGSMGLNHLRVISSHADMRLVAVSDPVAASLQSAVERTEAQGFESPIAMIREAELDAIVLAAPTTAHADLALAAIDSGVAVLVEKPLAATVDDAFRILQASRATGVPVQVGHVERFNPAVLELGRLLELGSLSSVYSITSRRAGPFPARIRDVGVTVDLATHDVDILSWIVRERPSRVYAETAQRIHADHEDLLFGLLHFPSGATGFVDVNWLTPTKRRTLVVVGEEGMFELDYLSQRLTFTRHPNAQQPMLIAGYATTFTGDVAELPVENREPLAAEHDAFVRVIREGSRPIVDVEDGLWAVAIATALLESARDGAPAYLETIANRLASAPARPGS